MLRNWIHKFLALVLPVFYKALCSHFLHRSLPHGTTPQRILIFNGAHIGDIVISTSILPILRSAYPQAQIGFVTGSWSRMVLKNHPDIAFLHCIDHWLLDRSGKSMLSKIRNYRRTRRIALREIRETQYDLALHIYTWSYPDLMEISWCAGIPIRLGFGKSVMRRLATAVTEIPQNHFLHQSELQAEILRPLHLQMHHFKKRKATLAESTPEAIDQVCALLNVTQIDELPYCVIHMGSGAPIRELSLSVWREVSEALVKSYTLVFTGKGERENANADTVISGLSGCTNACDRLSWDGFVAALRFAHIVYGVESMAGHVAAAVGTRCVVAYTGMAGVARWRPESPECTVLTQHVSCAPCLRPHGCKEMACIRSVSALDFIQSFEQESIFDDFSPQHQRATQPLTII